MMRKKRLAGIVFTLVVVVWTGCVEPFAIKSENYSEFLVVEGHLTTEMKKHQVRISKTAYVNDQKFLPETGVTAFILAGNGQSIPLGETSPGTYTTPTLAGIVGMTYRLQFTRSDGRKYASDEVELRDTPPIGNIYAKYVADVPASQRGIQIFVDTEDPEKKSRFFRWEYEETYVVKTPFPSNYEWLGGSSWALRTQPVGICYPSDSSSNVLIKSNLGLNEDKVIAFPIRFLNKDSYALRIKYSIIVRQYSLSEVGYTYWKTLKDVNESQGTLYDRQPGSVAGNISVEDAHESVLGYFDASVVSEKRIFLTPDEFAAAGYVPPGYQTACVLFEPVVLPVDQIGIYMAKYPTYLIWDAIGLTPNAKFELLPRFCCDCTNIGTNIKPSFWP
jgi:hypothetical protein